ncbi:MAG: AraC family transcriptional regulator [Clostridia bacterium]|nr:AraC family transcriptional regulator [Clostridia bacterium]
MKQIRNKPTVRVDVMDMRLQVIRVGTTPRLSAQSATKTSGHIHSHFTYEVFFITEGSLTLVTGEGSATYERKVIIVPPRIGHYTRTRQSGSFCLLFSFEKGKCNENALKRLRERLDVGVCELPLSEDTEYYIRAIARKSEENSPDAEEDVSLLTTLIFGELMRLLLPDGRRLAPQRSGSKHIAAIETYINTNYHRRLTLSEVAAEVYLSTRQVSRILRSEYGCTLSQLVIDKKLAQAQMLLRSTELSIEEISQKVGIGSANYFYTLFQKKLGTTPLKYRREHQRQEKGKKG